MRGSRPRAILLTMRRTAATLASVLEPDGGVASHAPPFVIRGATRAPSAREIDFDVIEGAVRVVRVRGRYVAQIVGRLRVLVWFARLRASIVIVAVVSSVRLADVLGGFRDGATAPPAADGAGDAAEQY